MSNGTDAGIPAGWTLTTLGEAFAWGSGGTPKSTNPEYYGGDIPWVIIGDLNDGIVSQTQTCITDLGLLQSSAKWVEEGSVLVAMYGSIGKLGIAGKCLTTNQAIAFTHPEPVVAHYLFYYLRHKRDELSGLGKGGTQSNISQTVIKAFPFPLAPLPEQHRIVAEIETQLTRLDAAVAALERSRANLKRYRAAVLKAACEGRLVPTEAAMARAEERGYESGEDLLLRYGKSAKPSPDLKVLEAIPEGWVWTSWELLAKRVTVGFVGPMKHEYVSHGVPFLRSQNVRENRYQPEGLLHISCSFHEKLSKSKLRPGDLAVVRSGSIGVTCVIPESLPDANCADLVVIQGPQAIVPQFGSYYMNSIARRRINEGKVGIALTHFNTKSVAQLPVPLPPIAEQLRIVAEVERRLSVVEEMERAVAHGLTRAAKLRQAILRKAFAGELVPQDPNDEPASVLLDRIRAERAAGVGGKAGRRGRGVGQRSMFEVGVQGDGVRRGSPGAHGPG